MRSLWKVPASGGQPSGGDSDSGAGGVVLVMVVVVTVVEAVQTVNKSLS